MCAWELDAPSRAHYLDVLHPRVPDAVERKRVAHAGVQAVVSRVEQDVWPPDRVVVPPGVQSRELRQRRPRLGQQRAGLRAHLLPLSLPPRVLLGLVQRVQGVGVIDMGVRVLALVIGERLVGRREVGRLEVRGRGVRQRRGARVGSLRDRAQLGQPRAVTGHAIVAVLEGGQPEGGERKEKRERRERERDWERDFNTQKNTV